MAKVLIGCEESQTVCKAFRELGIDAYSCDLKKCSGGHPDWHLQMDVFDAISLGCKCSKCDGRGFYLPTFSANHFVRCSKCRGHRYFDWDIGIFFPDCTHLSGAGAPSWKIKQADGRQQAAFDFVIRLSKANIPRIAIENPTGYLNTHWRKPDQIINPYQFGQPYKKRTCLWLINLPKLEPTKIIEPLYHWTSNSTQGGRLKDGSRRKSKLPIRKAWDNSTERSKSFEGIAKAMAEQWGNLLIAGYGKRSVSQKILKTDNEPAS